MSETDATRRNDKDDVKALLLAQIDTLARELAPDGHRAGRYWMARCPWRADRNAGSFWITLHGAYAGAWVDAASDDKGDVFRLIDKAVGLNGDFVAVMKWSRGWLGIGTMSEAERRQRVSVAARAREEAEAGHAEAREKNRRRAQAYYINARKHAFSGSPADLYLKSRGIDVSAMRDKTGRPRVPGAIGYLPAMMHWETQTEWPCLAACMTAPDGTFSAIHRTFLKTDGSNKAPVRPARKIWPSGYLGSAIRIWRGETGMDVKDAAACGVRETLLICEGVEDGLSLALACPQFRIWCAGTLGNLGRIVLPECIDDVVVVADNDWGKAQAEKALDAALDHFASQGVSVRVARSHIGKDVNDALRGMA